MGGIGASRTRFILDIELITYSCGLIIVRNTAGMGHNMFNGQVAIGKLARHTIFIFLTVNPNIILNAFDQTILSQLHGYHGCYRFGNRSPNVILSKVVIVAIGFSENNFTIVDQADFDK